MPRFSSRQSLRLGTTILLVVSFLSSSCAPSSTHESSKTSRLSPNLSRPFDPSKIRELHFKNVCYGVSEDLSGARTKTEDHYKCVVPGEEIRPLLEHLVPVDAQYKGAFMAGSVDAKLDYDGKEIGINWSDIKMRPKTVLIVDIEDDSRGRQMLDEPYGRQFLDAVFKHYAKD